MKILQRLYLRDFLKLLLLIVFGLSAVFSLIDLTGRIDDFSVGSPSVGNLMLYAFFNVPKYFVYLLPLSVLVCSLYTFSQAFHRKEITAIRTAGGKTGTLFRPFIAAGVVLGLISFFTGEIAAPYFSHKATEFRNTIRGKNRSVIFNDGGLWLKSNDGSPVKIDLYNIEKKVAKGINIFVTGKGVLKEEILAEKATWDGTVWVLQDITRYDMSTGRIQEIGTMAYPNLESPDFFAGEIKTTDEMGFFELYRYMERLKNAGFNNTKLAVDINSKISFPLINVFMMLLGISLSLRVGFGGGLFNAGLGLLISLLYWFSYTFSLSMGYAGILPPALAAWVIPLVFGVLAISLFARLPE